MMNSHGVVFFLALSFVAVCVYLFQPGDPQPTLQRQDDDDTESHE